MKTTQTENGPSKTQQTEPALPDTPLDGEWKGHINGKMARFRFEHTKTCGLVGQYTTVVREESQDEDSWVLFTKITYEEDILTLQTPDWFVQGLVTENRVSGPHVSSGHGNSTGIWDMYQ